MQIDTTKIDELLANGKYAEAKKMIEEVFATKLEGEEDGALLTDLASVYLDVTNSIEGKYLESLKNASEILSRIDQAESKIDASEQLVKAKSLLNM